MREAAPHIPDSRTPQAIDTGIRLEAARDTLRRWLLDYPGVFGGPSGGAWDQTALRTWKDVDSPAALTAYCRAHIFDMAPDAWLALEEDALDAWIEAEATFPAQWLRHGLAEPLRRNPAPAAAALLEWAGAHAQALLDGSMPAPTPPHAQSDIAATRRDLPCALLLHRLRHVARACIDAPAPERGGSASGDIGIGWARTARGLLLHLARVEGGCVTAYRILPPTCWNAGAGGLLASTLQGLASSQARRCAEQLLLLLDPCAPFEITLTGAPEQLTQTVGSTNRA
jgi:hypothetical protein